MERICWDVLYFCTKSDKILKRRHIPCALNSTNKSFSPSISKNPNKNSMSQKPIKVSKVWERERDLCSTKNHVKSGRDECDIYEDNNSKEFFLFVFYLIFMSLRHLLVTREHSLHLLCVCVCMCVLVLGNVSFLCKLIGHALTMEICSTIIFCIILFST